MFTVLKRAFSSNLQQVSALPSEQVVLQAQGIQHPTLQAYFAWRRSLMVFVVVCMIPSVGLSTYRQYFEDDRPGIFETMAGRLSKQSKAVLPLVLPIRTGETELESRAKAAAQQLLNAAKAIMPADEDDAAPSGAKTEDAEVNEEDDDDDEAPKTLLTRIDDQIHLVSLALLLLAAIAVIIWWPRLRFTFQIMVATFAFSFLTPILLSFCPWSWWDGEAAVPTGSVPMFLDAQRVKDGLIEGLTYLAMLLPNVLSLLPGVQRACIKVKTLLPQSVLPGWFLVTASPFYGLFMLVICVTIYQIFSSPLVIIGMLLVMGSSLIYGIRMQVFTRPLVTESDFKQLHAVQRLAGLMTMIAGALLLTYVTTHRILGMHLLGLDPKTSLMQPIDLIEFALEITGRSMFMTVFGADLFVRMNLIAWKNARDFQSSQPAQNYDETMAALERAA